jgi:hypothetical protein
MEDANTVIAAMKTIAGEEAVIGAFNAPSGEISNAGAQGDEV